MAMKRKISPRRMTPTVDLVPSTAGPEMCGACGGPKDWRKQRAALNDKIADLGAQVEELRAAQPMTADERRDIDRRMTEHRVMHAAEAAIRQWLIDRKKLGEEAYRDKTFDQVVIACLEGRL